VRVLIAAFVLIAAAPPETPIVGPIDPPMDGETRAMLHPRRLPLLDLPALFRRLELPPNAVIADVGAGPGLLTLAFAREVPKGKVIATDIRRDLLDILISRAAAERIDNIETLLVSADQPGLAPRSADVIILCQVDHYLPDRRQYFRALAGVLRPGGRIVLLNYRQYRDQALEDAKASSLHILDEWRPSRPFYATILAL
jgi:SAM-dependent methyltransferase